MSRIRLVVLGAVATVVLVVAVTLGHLGPDERPACGCDPVPPMSLHAKPAAARFESLVLTGNVDGAWAMLTDTARARYGDVAGFRPVVQRLAATYLAGAGSDWMLLSPMEYGMPPVTGVVARRPAPAARRDPALVAQQAIMVSVLSSSEWRADPEPAIRDVRAHADGTNRLRLEHADTDRHRLGMWILDATGASLTHGWTSTPDSYTVHKPGGPITNPLLLFVTGSSDGRTWWVGTTTVTIAP